jgi:hypothetical protein
MKKYLIAAMAAATVASSTVSFVSAQTPVERRAQRNLQQAERQAQRAINRSSYYNDNSWKQVSPWITKYNLQSNRRAANAVNNVAQAANNVARATNNVARATANATARFGFNNPNANANAQTAWFYDYYQLPPTYFSVREGADAYGSAARYRDTDNDGIYDGVFSYRDSDNDGVYDEYDRIDFAETDANESKDSNADKQDSDDDSLFDAKRHTVRGQVEASKEVKVNGSMNTVVRVKGEKESLIVDLGPTSELKGITVKEGTEISASGPMMQVGEKQVLLADKVTIENKEMVVVRHPQRMVGTIVEMTNTEGQEKDTVIAVVKTDQGHQLIDLGAASQLEVKIEPQTEIVFWGAPVRMRDHSVVMADKVEVNGKAFTIKRW